VDQINQQLFGGGPAPLKEENPMLPINSPQPSTAIVPRLYQLAKESQLRLRRVIEHVEYLERQLGMPVTARAETDMKPTGAYDGPDHPSD
jgi:hypothetical protein